MPPPPLMIVYAYCLLRHFDGPEVSGSRHPSRRHKSPQVLPAVGLVRKSIVIVLYVHESVTQWDL